MTTFEKKRCKSGAEKIGKNLKKSIINCALCVRGKIFVEREANEKREP